MGSRTDARKAGRGRLLENETERLLPRRHHEYVRSTPGLQPLSGIRTDTFQHVDASCTFRYGWVIADDLEVGRTEELACSPGGDQVQSALARKVAADKQDLDATGVRGPATAFVG